MKKSYIKKIEETISNYVYSKHDFADKDFIIEHNPKTKNIFIKNFFSYDQTIKEGICQELTMRTYQTLKQDLQELELYRCVGFDRYFFCPQTKSEIESLRHCFLIGIEKNEIKKVLPGKELSNIIQTKGTLIDPTYNLVENYISSRYEIRDYKPQGTFIKCSKDLKLENQKSIPIGILGDSLVSISYNEDFPNKLAIGLTYIEENGERNKTWIDVKQDGLKEEIDKYKKVTDNKLLDLMLKFCDIKLEKTNNFFEEDMVSIN